MDGRRYYSSWRVSSGATRFVVARFSLRTTACDRSLRSSCCVADIPWDCLSARKGGFNWNTSSSVWDLYAMNRCSLRARFANEGDCARENALVGNNRGARCDEGRPWAMGEAQEGGLSLLIFECLGAHSCVYIPLFCPLKGTFATGNRAGGTLRRIARSQK